MSRNQLRLASAAGLSLAATLALSAADRPLLRRDSDLLKQKVATISGRVPTSRQPVRTPVTERELNAYLAYEMADTLPTGVVEPSIAILGTGRLVGRAVVDLDRVRKERNPASMLDPFSFLTGRMPVAATGVLHTSAGVGQFTLESATVAGVPVPKSVLQQIVTFYSRSADRPSGIRLDASFALPASIREIRVDPGQAIVVQ
jgi:hypothetical protein